MNSRTLRALAPIAAVVVMLLAAAGPSMAAPPHRLSQLTPSTNGSNPTGITDVNGTTYFVTGDVFASVLWTTDGTEGGTKRVAPISGALDLVALGKTAYFRAADPGHGSELWESDGTEAGTKIAKDINLGPASSFPHDLTVVGDTLFFVVQEDVEHGSELWKVKEGGEPELVVDRTPGPGSSYEAGLQEYAGALYFTAYDEEHGVELWESDGSESGTKLVDDIVKGPESSSPGELTDAGGALYFSAYDEEHGQELWKFETGGEAQLVRDIVPGPESGYAFELTASAGGSLYFEAYNGVDSYQLWVSDGSEVGTQMVKDVAPGEFAPLSQLTEVGGTLFFTVSYGLHSGELWSSDGTEGGTDVVKEINSGTGALSDFTEVGGSLFFTGDDGVHGPELWSSDGTEAGTGLVKDIVPGAEGSFPGGLTNVGGTLYMSANLNGYGNELFVSDGTELGTRMVKDIETSPTFPISEVTAAGGLVYFAGEDRLEGAGQELWVSDGTAAGTKMVEDIDPGVAGSHPQELTNVNGKLFFVVVDSSGSQRELWTSDGTEGGTHSVKDFGNVTIYELANVQGALFFVGRDEEHGPELWRSDGTEDGTELVKDIHPGTEGSNPVELSDAGGLALFTADDGSHGQELWSSDGTEEGTQMVKDINPDQFGRAPRWRFPPYITRRLYGLPMYFGADDGVHGWELWETDGTEEGTKLLKDIEPGPASSLSLTGFLRFESHTFFGAFGSGLGLEPWQTDGTEAGTHIAKDINPGAPNSGPTDRAVSKGVIYFNADDGSHGGELWRSDGTDVGTTMVKDINPGPAASFVGGSLPIYQELTNLNGELYFSAEDGVHGEELWQSGGTEAGTQQVADLNAGAGSSSPRELAVSGSTLFFTADEGTGRQLWSFDSPLPADQDEDGIADEIDTEPGVASDSFSDQAATAGTIVHRNGLDVTITDASIVDGVNIKVGPGAGEVELTACAGYTLKVKAGTEADVTCGSIRVEVVTGEAEIVLEDGETVVLVPGGVSAKVSEEEDGSFKIENLGGGDVTVTTDGEVTTVGPGDPPVVLEPPVAVGDLLTVGEDAAATTVDALGNDTDTDGGEMTIESVGSATHGTSAVSAGGSGLTYTPAHDYCGPDAFTYTLNGGSTATVTVTVTCVDDPPGAVADQANVNEDDPAAAIAVLANDTDIDAGPRTIASASDPAHGTTVVTGGGTGLTYAPDHDYCGPDSFTYTLNGGSIATATISVICVDDAPVAGNDDAVLNEDAPATAIAVLGNDSDVDAGPMSIVSASQPAHGTTAVTGGGTGLTYKPSPDYCGPDAFTYTLNGGSTATVTVTVTCVDDLPGATDDAASLTEDDPAEAIPVLADDVDIDAGAKTIVTLTRPAHGTAVITGGGTGLTYAPDHDYCGPDSFTYSLNGGASATVSVSVACVDDPPLAAGDSATLTEDAGATAIDALADDTDIDAGPKSIAAAGNGGHGTVTITGGGSGLAYKPAPNYCGTDYFFYRLNGGSSAEVDIRVVCVDDPPVALADSAKMREDGGKARVLVLANDIDFDGGPIAIASVTRPHHGRASIAGTRVDYRPKHDFCGKDSFSYALNGGASATVTVRVKCRRR